jgi:hypothetical protein
LKEYEGELKALRQEMDVQVGAARCGCAASGSALAADTCQAAGTAWVPARRPICFSSSWTSPALAAFCTACLYCSARSWISCARLRRGLTRKWRR